MLTLGSCENLGSADQCTDDVWEVRAPVSTSGSFPICRDAAAVPALLFSVELWAGWSTGHFTVSVMTVCTPGF